jgi:hypothetical protein
MLHAPVGAKNGGGGEIVFKVYKLQLRGHSLILAFRTLLTADRM